MMQIPIWAFALICLFALIGLAVVGSITYTVIAIWIQTMKEEKDEIQSRQDQ